MCLPRRVRDAEGAAKTNNLRCTIFQSQSGVSRKLHPELSLTGPPEPAGTLSPTPK